MKATKKIDSMEQHYDSYKDSGIVWLGQIPSHWEVHTLAQTAAEHYVSNKNIHHQNLLSLSYGRIIKKDIKSTEGLLPESFDTYQVVYVGNIILRLTDLQNDHRSLRVGLCTQEGIITSAYLALQPKFSVSPTYLYYYLHTVDKLKVLYGMGAGLRQNLNWQELRRLPVILPSLAEQEAIAAYLDRECGEYDKAVAQQQKMIDLLAERKRIIISHAVTRGLNPEAPLRPSGIDWLGDIPAHWEVKKLKSVAQVFGRIGFRGYTAADLVEEGEGAITLSPSNMKDMKMDYSHCSYISWAKYEESPEIKIQNGDILYVKTGSTYGKSVLVDNLPHKSTINPQISVLKDITCCAKFLSYYLHSSYAEFQSEIAVIGGTIPTISQSKILNYSLPVPPLAEQEAIAAYLDDECAAIDKAIEQKKLLIELIQERKQIMINNVVTGKIKVS